MENYLKEMLVTFGDAGVEFVVGGGVACVLHGVERVTLDLDGYSYKLRTKLPPSSKGCARRPRTFEID
jgi:hypothetical protein